MYDSPCACPLAGPGSTIDPEDRPLTRVRWENPPVSSVFELPPLLDQERQELFFSREDEVANRAHVVLESTLVRCAAGFLLWCSACWLLVRCTRCLMNGKDCRVLGWERTP